MITRFIKPFVVASIGWIPLHIPHKRDSMDVVIEHIEAIRERKLEAARMRLIKKCEKHIITLMEQKALSLTRSHLENQLGLDTEYVHTAIDRVLVDNYDDETYLQMFSPKEDADFTGHEYDDVPEWLKNEGGRDHTMVANPEDNIEMMRKEGLCVLEDDEDDEITFGHENENPFVNKHIAKLSTKINEYKVMDLESLKEEIEPEFVGTVVMDGTKKSVDKGGEARILPNEFNYLNVGEIVRCEMNNDEIVFVKPLI